MRQNFGKQRWKYRKMDWKMSRNVYRDMRQSMDWIMYWNIHQNIHQNMHWIMSQNIYQNMRQKLQWKMDRIRYRDMHHNTHRIMRSKTQTCMAARTHMKRPAPIQQAIYMASQAHIPWRIHKILLSPAQ